MSDKALERLNAHRDWANALLLEWYLMVPEGDEYCLKMLTHLLLGEKAWLGRIRNASYPFTWGAALSPAELVSLRQAHKTAWEEVLAGSEGDLARVLYYKRFNGDPDSSSLTDIVTHVCTHDMYHRGQIAAHAARTYPGGPKVPPTDFIVFSRLSQLH